MGRLISESGYVFLRKLMSQGKLSADEYEICEKADALDNPNLFLEYFTYRPELGATYCPHCKTVSSMCSHPEQHRSSWKKSGVQLPEWQVKLHFGDYTDVDGNPAYTIFLLGGPGAGKSAFLAISSFIHCALNPGYKEITAAPLRRQNQGVETEIDKWLKGTPAWRIFMDTPAITRDPFLKYHFANGSEHWIMTSGATAGGAQGAKSMLSLEADRADYDEAGNDRHFAVTYVTLGTRTRGIRPDGTPRGITMPDGSRRSLMLVISNPNDQSAAEEFNVAVNLARTFPNHTVIEVGIAKNLAISKGQRTAIQSRTILGYLAEGKTEQEALDYLAGRSTGVRGEIFDRNAIDLAIDENYIIPEKYFRRKMVGASSGGDVLGTNLTFLLPPQKQDPYIITCDPGTARAPNRNSPVIQVWNVKDPKHGVLTGLFWGSLEPGKPESYLYTLAEWIKFHNMCYAYIDTTGPQAVLVGHSILTGVKNQIVPVDMSGNTKRLVQFVTSMALSRGFVTLPNLSPPYNFQSQLSRYRFDDKKIAQDLVVGIMLFAYWQYMLNPGGDNEDTNGSGASGGDTSDAEELIEQVQRRRGHPDGHRTARRN